MFGSLIYEKPNIIASISVSILIILIINPYKILDVGMQLSYGGTLGIILFNKILEEKIKISELKNRLINRLLISIQQMLIVSISANLIIFPIIAFHYNTISLTFFISNILAGPISFYNNFHIIYINKNFKNTSSSTINIYKNTNFNSKL